MNKKTKTKYHIFLVTTKGCRGCQIMDKLIQDALKDIKYPIEYHVSDYTEYMHKDKRLDKFQDFPTTLFVNDGEVRIKLTGTYPTSMIKDKIAIAFNIAFEDTKIEPLDFA